MKPTLQPGAATRALASVLPALPAGAAAAGRVLFDVRCAAFLSRYCAGMDVRIGRRAGARPALRASISSLAGDLVVDLDPQACAAWAMLDALARQPEQQVLACALANELIARASQTHGFEDIGLEVRALEPSDGAKPRPPATASVRIDRYEFGLVELDAAFGLFAAEEMRAQPQPLPPGLLQLGVRGSVRIGERRLPAGVLRSVQRGDVFLLGPPPLAVQWRIGERVVLRAPALLDGRSGALQLQSAPVCASQESEMSEPEALLAEVELPIHFEIQASPLALGEIASLGPGHVIALDVPAESAGVQLVCQGRRVGSGQLVVVGEHLGVRIDRMAWGHDAAADL